MNPFDLHGPAFLRAYVAFGALVLVGLVMWRRRGEPARAARFDAGDPYLIAHLRGGAGEVVRVALVSLMDRGLVVAARTGLAVREDHPDIQVASRVELAVLGSLRSGDPAAAIQRNRAVLEAVRTLDGELVRAGLVPDRAMRALRRVRVLIAAAALWSVATVKVWVAVERGRHNVGFLLLLAALFTLGAVLLRGGRLTRSGWRALRDLRTLYGGVRRGAAALAPGAAEVPLLAAVFGLSALPVAVFPHVGLVPAAARDAGAASAGFYACGSASSCGGGGGGGCGGGGCGGCGS